MFPSIIRIRNVRGIAAKKSVTDRVTSGVTPFSFMLARTRLLRPTARVVCVRCVAQKAASDASKAAPERTTAAVPLPGGE